MNEHDICHCATQWGVDSEKRGLFSWATSFLSLIYTEQHTDGHNYETYGALKQLSIMDGLLNAGTGLGAQVVRGPHKASPEKCHWKRCRMTTKRDHKKMQRDVKRWQWDAKRQQKTKNNPKQMQNDHNEMQNNQRETQNHKSEAQSCTKRHSTTTKKCKTTKSSCCFVSLSVWVSCCYVGGVEWWSIVST